MLCILSSVTEFAMSRLVPAAMLAILCAGALPAFASESLKSPAEVTAALEAGDHVSVSADLARCTPNAGTPASKTRGGAHIQAYRIIADGTVSFADSHFTVANDGKPIQQFMRYQLHQDGTVSFTTYMYDLPGLQPRGPVLAYQCKINEGIGFHFD